MMAIIQTLFAITPLNWVEWKAVLYLSAPVLAIDEVLKYISVRTTVRPRCQYGLTAVI